MSIFLKKYIFLLLAALAVVVAAGFFLANKGVSNSESYLDSIQSRTNREIQRVNESSGRILNRLPVSDDKPFVDLLMDSTYPYYVYKDTTLIFWSDHSVLPEQKLVNRVDRDTMAYETDQGAFLLLTHRKRVNGNRYTLFSLIKLYAHVPKGQVGLVSAYNPAIFPVAPRSLRLTAAGELGQIRDARGQALFYVDPPNEATFLKRSVPFESLVLLSLALFLMGVQLVFSFRYFRSRHRYGLGLTILLAFMVLVRGLMLRFSIPLTFYEGTIFNPQNYNGTLFSPSLGDFMLNCACMMFLFLYVNSIYFRTVTYRRLFQSDALFKALVSLLILLVSYVAYYLCYRELINIYERSSFTLDITLSITFSSLKIVALTIFVILSAIYFMVTHLVVSLFIRLNPNRVRGTLILTTSAVLSILFSWLLRIELEGVFMAHIVYLFLLYYTRLPRSFYSFRYRTTVYYFVGALVCALMTTYVVENQESQKDILRKKEFGQQLVSDHDSFTEYLLNKNSDVIQDDTELQRLFDGQVPLAPEMIQQRIYKQYLDQYLQQYRVEILSFDRRGLPLDSRQPARDFASYERAYKRSQYATSYTNVFLVDGVAPPDLVQGDSLTEPLPSLKKRYLSFVSVGPPPAHVGYLLLFLEERQQLISSQYPEMAMEEKLVYTPEAGEYSYAIFESIKQLFSSGPYNYERKFPNSLLNVTALYKQGIVYNGYNHIGQKGAQGRRVVVSSRAWDLKELLANFSFLYLILVVVVSIVIFGYALRHGFADLPMTYSTKIQVLLNAAFILPLLIVLFFVLKVIASNYEESQQTAYLASTRNLSANILGNFEQYKLGRMSRAYFEQKVQELARNAHLDINLYDTTGRMLLSSNPLMYHSGLLPELINPVAQKQIIEQKEKQVLLEESMGSKSYSTTYSEIKSYNQKMLGVLSVPYFDSKSTLDRQIIDIVASVLIVFMAMLLIFLLVSYLAANQLIEPLKVLTRKISTTTLNQPNEPLPWHTNDEIGQLIRKYNRMLVNLEMSKQALSSNEKQSAWREMARQVAHEIKNPLTPMKLTLQQLQRTIRRDDPAALEKVGRAMESIIEQIDNIGYIAQSFSDIARMPPPQNEVFEITSVIEKAYDLYSNDKSIDLKKEVEEGPIYVSGDRQQFGASITNLILNAKQSVPESRSVEIFIRLYRHNETAMIEIQDNGSGIPPNIRSRVFLPNFTTKEGGTGLGLAMAKRIIEHAGGSIWFESEEEKGTIFFLTVPLVEAV